MTLWWRQITGGKWYEVWKVLSAISVELSGLSKKHSHMAAFFISWSWRFFDISLHFCVTCFLDNRMSLTGATILVCFLQFPKQRVGSPQKHLHVLNVFLLTARIVGCYGHHLYPLLCIYMIFFFFFYLIVCSSVLVRKTLWGFMHGFEMQYQVPSF